MKRCRLAPDPPQTDYSPLAIAAGVQHYMVHETKCAKTHLPSRDGTMERILKILLISLYQLLHSQGLPQARMSRRSHNQRVRHQAQPKSHHRPDSQNHRRHGRRSSGHPIDVRLRASVDGSGALVKRGLTRRLVGAPRSGDIIWTPRLTEPTLLDPVRYNHMHLDTLCAVRSRCGTLSISMVNQSEESDPRKSESRDRYVWVNLLLQPGIGQEEGDRNRHARARLCEL
jgi:hypothetical protein